MDTKQLRQKILDLAIRGKLVPQDPNDEPARVLLERVKAEKERLIAEGKIKRSKKSAASSDKPHYAIWDLPRGWEWVKLSDLASFGGGKTPSMSDKSYWENGKHLWVTSKDMKSHRIRDSRMKISDEALSIMTQYKPGTILIVTRSGILRHSLPIAILERDATINQDLKAISFYIQDLHPYIYYAIKAQESFILKEYHKDGTTVDSINFEKFSEILLPIPPKQEQIRIITTIEKLFGLIEEIDNNKKDLQELTRHTKSIILDMAISGKLVVQDPADEPAVDLLQRVNPNAVVSADTSHYALPTSWAWVKGKDLFLPMKSTRPTGHTFKYIDIDSIDNVNQCISAIKVLPSDQAPSRASRFTEKGNILFSMVRPYLRNIAIVTEEGCIASTGFYVCRQRECLDHKYLYYLMTSKYVVDGLNSFMKGDNSPSINKGNVDEYVFPLPPLNEQKRIAAKVDELFAVIDQIQQSLE